MESEKVVGTPELVASWLEVQESWGPLSLWLVSEARTDCDLHL